MILILFSFVTSSVLLFSPVSSATVRFMILAAAKVISGIHTPIGLLHTHTYLHSQLAQIGSSHEGKSHTVFCYTERYRLSLL